MLTVKAILENTTLLSYPNCIGIVEKYDEGDEPTFITSYDGYVTGTPMEGYECILSGSLPDYSEIESGHYRYTVRFVPTDKNGNNGEESDWFDFMVDNNRPDMSVVSPHEDQVYGAMLPVSLNLDDVSEIVDDTVKFQIKEIGWWGNVWCLGGCEETPWLLLTEQDNGLYAGTFNLSEYGISGDSRYTFDAIACDELYDSSDLDEDGNPVIAGNDRNGHHCKQISVHGAVPEDRVECNDGLDNDWDEDIDYPSDDGCYSGEDDDEGVICGDGYLEGEEECDDGNIVSGDGCSDVCMIEVPEPECGNGVIESEEECDDGEDNGVLCSPDYGSICIYCSETCTNTVFEGGFCGDSIVNGPEQCDNSLCGEGYVCNIYCDCIID
jgi:cysteine-rich repeat protein